MKEHRAQRFKRRFSIRFWREGDPNPHTGYTTNVSLSGLFIATNTPVSPGERVQVEILGDDPNCTVLGEVVHAARVSPLLKRLREAGMGVRLLGTEELIGLLLERDPGELREAVEFAVDKSAPASSAIPDSEAETHEFPSAEPEVFEETVSPLDPTLFSVRFNSDEAFMKAFRRELQHGGLFIRTEHPPGVDEDVTIELRASEQDTVRLPARVVQRRGPDAAATGSQPPGINVDFKDLRTALEELNRLRQLLSNK